MAISSFLGGNLFSVLLDRLAELWGLYIKWRFYLVYRYFRGFSLPIFLPKAFSEDFFKEEIID